LAHCPGLIVLAMLHSGAKIRRSCFIRGSWPRQAIDNDNVTELDDLLSHRTF